jgi:KipI family sensor histidine kinase inhibitor
VLYGGAQGPDLAAAAAAVGLRVDDLIAAHTAAEQRVYMLGFAPGLPYIGDAPPALAGLPRLATPRTRVPRGAVGIVGQQTVVYPRSTPGGWRIIGQTPIEIWDETRPAPAYFGPNDRVQFESITVADWDRLVGPPADW